MITPQVGDSFQFRMSMAQVYVGTVTIQSIANGKLHLIANYPRWLEIDIPISALDQCIDYNQYWPVAPQPVPQYTVTPMSSYIPPYKKPELEPEPVKEPEPKEVEEYDPYDDVRNW